MARKETFKQTGSVGALADNAVWPIDLQTAASAAGNLPFNRLSIVSTLATAIIKVYLDRVVTGTPDFIVQGKGNLFIEPDDGISFNVVYVQNVTGAQLTDGDVTYRVGKVKEI